MAPMGKHYVVGALTATIAVAVVVTIFFVVLSPARVHLSVTYARRISRGQSEDGVVDLQLILAANNTSRRAAIKYESMFVDLTNNTSPDFEYFVRTNLTTALPLSQRHSTVANFAATLRLLPGVWTDSSGNLTNNTFAVVVTAVVTFKVGIAQTRLYDIKLTCRPVIFILVDDPATPSGAPDSLPVICVSC